MPPPSHHHNNIHIRPASSALQDGARILAFTDSQLPFLASIGSGGQCGSASNSAKEGHQTRYRELIERSEKTQTWGEKDWVKVSILEVEVQLESLPEEVRGLVTTASQDGKLGRLPVAAMVLEGHSCDYTRPVLAEQDEADPFVYVRYLVSDRRVGSVYSRGAGRLLLEHADCVARSLGVGRLALDGWSGNGGVLVGYYEKLGFVRLGDVDDDGWPATVLERRVKAGGV